jgi:hypothetical protein
MKFPLKEEKIYQSVIEKLLFLRPLGVVYMSINLADRKMTPKIQTTVRIVRSLGVLLTLLAMFSISSTQVVVEECSQETVSQQLELVMARRAVRRNDDTEDSADLRFRPDQYLSAAKPTRNRFFAALTERANLNGSGTHLLI